MSGGTRGIGRATVEALVKVKAQVTATCTGKGKLDALKAEIPSMEIIYIDMSKWKETEKAFSKLPPQDCLMNNAEPAGKVTEDRFDKVFAVNVKAMINVTQLVTRKMVEVGIKGSVVNISSYMSQKIYPRSIAYRSSKAAVDHITRGFAKPLALHGTRVNTVHPNIVVTNMGNFFADLVRETEPESPIPLTATSSPRKWPNRLSSSSAISPP